MRKQHGIEAHQKIGEIMIHLGFLDEDKLLLIISKQSGMKIVDLDKIKISSKIINRLPGIVAVFYHLIPIGEKKWLFSDCW